MIEHLPKGMRLKRQITRDVLQQENDVTFFVTFESLSKVSDIKAVGRGNEPIMRPARVCDVINEETGELQVLIMNRVLESELDRHFGIRRDDDGELAAELPVETYVGHTFAIRPSEPQKGKGDLKYRRYMIAEIEIEGRE